MSTVNNNDTFSNIGTSKGVVPNLFPVVMIPLVVVALPIAHTNSVPHGEKFSGLISRNGNRKYYSITQFRTWQSS